MVETLINPNQIFSNKGHSVPAEEFITAGSTHTSFKILKNSLIVVNVSGVDRVFKTVADTEYEIANVIDTGSLTNGKDYCIYLVDDGSDGLEVKVSLDKSYPEGYSATNSRKIGGFHTLCVGVTAETAPALVDTNIWATHPAIGYDAGDIIPNSIWSITHRPISEPYGMVYVDKIDKWVDIYLQSGTGTSTASAYEGTVINSRISMQHQWDMELVNKKLATDNDFTIFAEGSNQKTNIYGSAMPNPRTAGGHVDTNSKRMISGFFVEECCGYMWQWLDEIGPNGQNGWAAYGNDVTRGHSYAMPYILKAGGGYEDGEHSGSWARIICDGRSLVNIGSSARGVSLSKRVTL